MRVGDQINPDEILPMMARRFGDAVKSCWARDDLLCPCCLTRRIDDFPEGVPHTLSINAYMYRDKGVLIGYFLCYECAQKVMMLSKLGPRTTKYHQAIEANLIAA